MRANIEISVQLFKELAKDNEGVSTALVSSEAFVATVLTALHERGIEVTLDIEAATAAAAAHHSHAYTNTSGASKNSVRQQIARSSYPCLPCLLYLLPSFRPL